MSEDKNMQESFSDTDEQLLDFVDLENLEDLEGAEDLDLFGDLGDLSELMDISPVKEAASGENTASEDILGDSDMAVSEENAASEDILGDIDMAASGENTAPEDILGDIDMAASGENTAPEDIFEDSDIAASGENPAEETVSEQEDMAAPAMSDLLASDEQEEEALFSEIGDLDALFADGEDTLLSEENAESGDNNSEHTGSEDAPDIGFDIDELQTDGADDAADTAGLDGLDLDFFAGDTDTVESEEPGDTQAEEPESDSQGIDSMLDGLLSDLNMNDSIEDDASSETTEEEQDSLVDLLGLDNESDSGEEEPDDSLHDMLDLENMVPEKEKQPGFFKRVFGNIVTDEIAQKEREDAQREEEEAALKAEEEAKEKEEKEAKKAEKQAEKEARAAEKKKAKEERKTEKAAKKAERKAEREEEEAKELEVVGKLNKVGVSIIVIATAAFLVIEIAGTNMFGYSSAKREAVHYFEMGKYTEAYQEAIGTDMQEKDKEEYDKIKVVMKVQHAIDSYKNYDRIKYYPEALDALLRGVKRYDANIDEAMDLEVEKDMQNCRTQILSILREEFGLSEQDAYNILAMDKDTYTNRVIAIAMERK